MTSAVVPAKHTTHATNARTIRRRAAPHTSCAWVWVVGAVWATTRATARFKLVTRHTDATWLGEPSTANSRWCSAVATSAALASPTSPRRDDDAASAPYTPSTTDTSCLMRDTAAAVSDDAGGALVATRERAAAIVSGGGSSRTTDTCERVGQSRAESSETQAPASTPQDP